VDNGRGKGAAIRQSLQETTADIIVFLDADGSHNPADIPSLVAPIADGHTEVCVGSRFSGGTDELSVTIPQLVRTIGNVAMNIAINSRYGVELTDTLNGFRAVRRAVLIEVKLVENRHTIEQEMVMKVLANGYRVQNIPAHEYSRRFGTSHIAVWREWPRFVRCVFVNIFRRIHTRAHATPSSAQPAMLTWMTDDQQSVNASVNVSVNASGP
jgi:dolichol-phosphate mannosyltransferase